MRKFTAIATVCLLAAPAFAGLEARLTNGAGGNINGAGGGSFGVSLRDSATDAPITPSTLLFGNRGGPYTGLGTGGTFCVENVTFNPNTWYSATIDTDILNVGGGPGASASLTDATKNLFGHYVEGNLDAIHTIGTSQNANAALQALFWDLQGVNTVGSGYKSDNYDSLGSNQKDIYEDFWAYQQSNTSALKDGVRVLNLWSNGDYSGDKQSQLVVVVPAPGAVVLGMIGIGLASWIRRRPA